MSNDSKFKLDFIRRSVIRLGNCSLPLFLTKKELKELETEFDIKKEAFGYTRFSKKINPEKP